MRESVFSGSFYPKSKIELRDFIKSAMAGSKAFPDKPISIIVPHAGYIYSGTTASEAYASISKFKAEFDSVVIVGPNHTGLGSPIGVSMEDWKTPFGILACDKEFASAIINGCSMAEHDEDSHAEEHSIEVQLPFIQYIFGSIPFVAICMGLQDIEASKCVANAIYAASKKLKRKPLVIASSDFNHYESEALAKSKDMPLIKRLEQMDSYGFNKGVTESGDTACGYGPSTAASLYAKAQGAKKGTLLRYTNSGAKTGDMSSVVAYASIIFS
ncbi:MAG: AmmeMemoRadiSam system protein B [Candidatus Marsarchaeota archaeon]|nr:AmmeMemoRadiSam system protein B [Candidatus Marsarchaeota archaeon]